MAVTALSVAISCSRTVGSPYSLVTIPEVMIITGRGERVSTPGEGYAKRRGITLPNGGGGSRREEEPDEEAERKKRGEEGWQEGVESKRRRIYRLDSLEPVSPRPDSPLFRRWHRPWVGQDGRWWKFSPGPRVGFMRRNKW